MDFFKPSRETVETVWEWLTDSGIPSTSITHSANKAWFAFHASAKQMESLLHTEYHEFQDMQTGGVMPACDRYHVPEHITPHVDYITPGIRLLAPPEAPKDHQKRSLSKRQWPSGGPPWGNPRHHRPGPWPKHHKPSEPIPQNPKANLSTCDIVRILTNVLSGQYSFREANSKTCTMSRRLLIIVSLATRQ